MAVYDTGSNYQFYDKKVTANPRRSKFSLNHLHSTTQFFGENIPIYWNYTLPDSDYQVSIENLTRVLGLEVPLMSRIRLLIHGYYMPLSVIWKGAHNFYNTAMNLYLNSGSLKSLFTQPTMPRFKTSSQTLVTKHSLANYLGIPIGFDLRDTKDEFISALPFMAYALINKCYETKRYLMSQTEQKKWFTQDESAWRLPAAGFVGSSFTNPEFAGSSISLNTILNRYYADDYFSSARPSPQAGEPPSITFGTASISGNVDLSNARVGLGTAYSDLLPQILYGSDSDQSFSTSLKNSFVRLQPGVDTDRPLVFASGADGTSSYKSSLVQVYSNGTQGPQHLFPVTLDNVNLGFTLNQLRELNSATVELERMNRLDGSYTEYVQAFFGDRPSHADKYRPTYFGGCYAPVVVSEVLQTSSTDSEPSPLGSSAGHGISSSSNYLGTFHSNDFGIMMICASYIPDVMYHQGLDKKFSLQLQEEFPLPTRVGLGPEPILKKEIYAASNNPNDLFAYQDRFDSWRYEQNKVSGYLSDPDSLSYFPYTQVRHFSSEPTYSDSTFRLSQQNINLSAFMAPEEPPFISQYAIKINAVMPLPYRGIPEGLF